MTKDQLQNLIFAYDLSTLGIECNIADTLKNLNIEESVISEHIPTVRERAGAVAYQACWQKYQITYPSQTEEQFLKTLNMKGFEEVVGKVIVKLQDPISFSSLTEFYRVQSLNLTRLDKDRQVK
jgi:hypothetical protein